MNLILDEGLPLRAAAALREVGVRTSPVLELGLRGASDETILKRALLERAVVVTLDADFHQILALSGAAQPSVIRIRIEGLSVRELVDLLVDALQRCGEALSTGAVLSMNRNRIRLRKLPMRR